MRKVVLVGIWLLVVGVVNAQDKFHYIDLQPKGNWDLDKSFHNESGTEKGNDLSELPKGERSFAGIKFKIDKKMIQLGSNVFRSTPLQVQGIVVGKTLSKLHILHATGFGNAPPDNPAHVPDGTTIGGYRVNYEDKSSAVIPIVFGKDVRDWWYYSALPGVSRGKVAWEGSNKVARQANARIRLYLTTWDNPKQKLTVVSIDYFSSSETAAAPFCVAMTSQE